MRFPVRFRSHCSRLRFEHLEDRTTPTALRLDPPFALPAALTAVPDAVNVVMASTRQSAADEAKLAAAPFATRVDYLGFGIYRVTLASDVTAAQADRYYSRRPGVSAASPDTRVQIDQVPNDTSYSSLWGMPKISAPAAWDTATGSRSFVVADIDTGADYTHPDLANNIWIDQKEIPASIRSTLADTDGDGVITFWDLNAPANAGKVTDGNGNGYIDAGDILRPVSQGGWQDGSDNDGNGYTDDLVGWNFVANTNNPFDDNGHGTHTAGTIGAAGNNSRGVAGVNWAVSIMPLKFLDAGGSGNTSAAVSALNYAVAMGVKVSNNSWGGSGSDPALAAAIGRAKTAGHVFVAAAGNSGANIDQSPAYPASYSTTYNNVVTVAATGGDDSRASFSNFGTGSVTLAAPGVSILSTTPNNTYSYYSGTSMATPHVAGAIALFWSQHPAWAYTDVIAHLKSSVDAVPALTNYVQTGGRLDVAKFLASVGPTVTAAVNPGGSNSSLSAIRFTFDRPMDPSTFTAADVVSFAGPGGPISTAYTVTPVAGSNNTQFDVGFATQTALGAYTMVIGPDIRDTLGNRMNQNGNAVAGEVPADEFTASTAISGVTIVNSLGAGYAAGAGWQTATGEPANYYGGDTGYFLGAATSAASFTASGLAAGTYRVSATWLANANRPTNAQYTVADGSGNALATRTLNQEAAASDLQADGWHWADVGTVTVSAAGTLTVKVGGGQAGQYLDADAVRFELVSPPPPPPPPPPPGAVTVVDNGTAGYAAGAGWQTASGEPANYYGGGTGYFLGAATSAASFTASGLAAGTYRVSATWLANANRPTNAQYTVADGSGNALATRTLNQEAAASDLQADGWHWADVGTVTVSANGTLTVTLGGGQAGHYLDADAVRFEKIA